MKKRTKNKIKRTIKKGAKEAVWFDRKYGLGLERGFLSPTYWLGEAFGWGRPPRRKCDCD